MAKYEVWYGDFEKPIDIIEANGFAEARLEVKKKILLERIKD